MPQLKTHSWWPTVWLSNDHSKPTAEEVRANGVLKKVRRSADTLTLVVDCNGAICRATISGHFPEDTLILLRHIFSDITGKRWQSFEDLDIELGTFPVVK